MVDQNAHRKGAGLQLLQIPLGATEKFDIVERVYIETSQHTMGFYRKFGFELTQSTFNGFGQALIIAPLA